MIENRPQAKDCIAYVTTYPPRECGIATFTADLVSYTDELFSGNADTIIAAMNTASGPSVGYGPKVHFEIQENDAEDYTRVARALNDRPEIKIVSIQHEFGIFGEGHGKNIVPFLEAIEKPVVVTFHTVLPEPAPELKEVVIGILSHSSVVVVMTEVSKELLISSYGATPEKIRVIPHGIHPRVYTDGTAAKKLWNLSGKKVLTTFGLLGPGKGIEHAIRALPEIVKEHPDVRYLVLGATHPVILRREGEAYRNELTELSRSLGVQDNVVFHNRYLTTKELLSFLEATDIYLSLSQNPNQAVSGTLSYALGAGRAVASTAFTQAKELITPDVGALLAFGGHESIVREVNRLLQDPEHLAAMGRTAYFHTRAMTWPNVSLAYMTVFSELSPSLAGFKKCMLPINLDHIKRLTDSFGIVQFSRLDEPDPNWGYTIDDNARALVAMSWYAEETKNTEVESLAAIYLGFIERATNADGGFVNYFTTARVADDTLNNNENLEDANARALWALAEASNSKLSPDIVSRARALFSERTKFHRQVVSPRAASWYIKAFVQAIEFADNQEENISRVRQYADFLVDLYERTHDAEWQWFEESLTYSNGLLPGALVIAYMATKEERYLEVAKVTLDFLLQQSFEGHLCVPVGQAGWFKRGGKKERHDQQPEEVSALVLALQKMMLVSDDPVYHERAAAAFDWFLGNNLMKQCVYAHATGGCYDGIGEHYINLNQGAESTIAYLLARLSMDTIASADQRP